MPTLRKWERYVWLPWCVLAVVLTVKALLNPVRHSVFPIYSYAALGWWSDLPIYRVEGTLDLFRYPPLFAIALTPFAALGLTLGGILWAWLSLGVYGYGCRRFLRDVVPERWTAGREALFLTLCLVGGIRGLWNAQATPLAVGMVLIGAADLMRNRPWRAALWLGGATLVKLTPIVFVALLALVRSRALLPRLVPILAVGLLVPFLTRPVEVVARQQAEWLDQMHLNAQIRWPSYRDAWTLYQAGRWLGTGAPINLVEHNYHTGYWLVQLGAAGLTACWVLALRGHRAGRSQRVLAALALGGCWSLLFGGSVEHCTMVVVLPALFAALLLNDQPGRVGRPLLVASVGALQVFTVHAVADGLRPVVPFIDVAMPLAVVLFLVWLARWTWQLRPLSSSERFSLAHA